jgi:hypothetical protein
MSKRGDRSDVITASRGTAGQRIAAWCRGQPPKLRPFDSFFAYSGGMPGLSPAKDRLFETKASVPPFKGIWFPSFIQWPVPASNHDAIALCSCLLVPGIFFVHERAHPLAGLLD